MNLADIVFDTACAMEQATLHPWLCSISVVGSDGKVQMLIREVVQAPMHRPPIAEDMLPEGAELARADIFPAARFDDMPQPTRERYRGEYEIFLHWRKAHAHGKEVADLVPWVDYDPPYVSETVERWALGFRRYVGD